MTTLGAVLLVDSAPHEDDGPVAETLNASARGSGIVFTSLGAVMMIGGLALNPDPIDERGVGPGLEDRRDDAAAPVGEAPGSAMGSTDPRTIAGTRDPLRMYLAETCVGGDAAACRLLGVGVLRGTDVDPPDPEGASMLFDLACFMGDAAGCSLAGAL